ncbi:MAG: hypothetical protein GY856_36915 [bacterium]|nr:hypothetical protein [bacterium]
MSDPRNDPRLCPRCFQRTDRPSVDRDRLAALLREMVDRMKRRRGINVRISEVETWIAELRAGLDGGQR